MADEDILLDFRLKLEVQLKDKKEDIKGITIADVYGDPTQGLDMEAKIVKSYKNEPTQSTLKIYNLSTSTYNLIYEKGEVFRLSCARGKDAEYIPFYTGFPIRTIKAGKQTVLTSNEGFMKQDANAGRRGQNDLETEITLTNWGFARLYKSYQTGVTAELIMNDCINALGLPKGNIDDNIWNIFSVSNLSEGFTIRGDVQNTLNLMSNWFGFNWNINDMKFNLYDKNQADIKPHGILLTPNNSSTPERQDDVFKSTTKTIQKASKKKGIKGVKETTIQKISQGFAIKTQLLPFLQCGSTCILQGFGITGADGSKYIYKIEHTVNNTGLSAYSVIYCT